MRADEDPLYFSYIVNCVLNAFSSYTAVMLNIITILAMRKTSSLPKPLKTLLLSLAVSDLGVGLLIQPFYIARMAKLLQQSILSHSTITAYYFISGIFVYTSFFGVVALGVDRFLAIHLHLRYTELVTHKRVVAVVISIWVFSAILSSKTASFIPLDKSSVSVVFAIVIGLCFICTTIIYCKIYLTVRRHTNQIQVLQIQQVSQNGEMVHVARLRKSAVSAFYIYLVFLACCLPEYCRLVLSIFIYPSTTFMERFYFYSWTLLFLNSSLNPVIYCWRMRNIRFAIMDMLRNMIPSQN
ncbi:hypothetical protein ACROYT_G029638 [Oculina patagonica]